MPKLNNMQTTKEHNERLSKRGSHVYTTQKHKARDNKYEYMCYKDKIASLQVVGFNSINPNYSYTNIKVS